MHLVLKRLLLCKFCKFYRKLSRCWYDAMNFSKYSYLLARMQFIVISRSFYSMSGYRSIRKMPKTMAKEEERYVKKKKRKKEMRIERL